MRKRGASSPEGERLEQEFEGHAIELVAQTEALREAERELETSRAEYQDLFDSAPVAYLVVGMEQRIRAANRAAAELLGVDQKELLGMHISGFIAEDEAPAFERHRRQVICSRHKVRGRFTVVGRAAAQRAVMFESMCTAPVLEEWRTALVDMTETDFFERRSGTIERVQALGTHARGTVHEIENVLANITNSAELALTMLDSKSPVRCPLERSRQAAQHGTSVVARLLAFTGDERAEPGTVDLNSLVLSSERGLASRLGNRIHLVLELDAADARVLAEDTEMERVLFELTANAEHAMKNGGTLTIGTRNLELPCRGRGKLAALAAGSYVLFTVSDTGTGMDAATAEQALEPFFTTKPAGQGNGLGLALVQGVATRAGGAVALSTAIGRGTTVRLYLPRAFAPRRAALDGAVRRATLPAGFVVVVVVYDAKIRRGATEHFRAIGCESYDASDGFEALEVLKANRSRRVVVLAEAEQRTLGRPEFGAAARAIAPNVRIAAVSASSARDLSVPGAVDFARFHDAAVAALVGSSLDDA